MKVEEIHSLTTEEVIENIRSEQERLQKLKFAHAITPIENPMDIRFTRKLIARLKTELKERQIAEKQTNNA